MQQRATSGLAALAKALRLPSEPPGASCPAIGNLLPVIAVTDTSGRTTHPEVPTTACGAALNAVLNAIAALPWTTVGTSPVRQTESELAVTSGCSDQFKPMIALLADATTSQPEHPDTTPRAMRVCRYDLDPDPANNISSGSGATTYQSGKLASATVLDAASGGQLLAAVASARAATKCDQPQAPFAVVDPADGAGPSISVELGGCYRAVLDGDGYLRQLDAAAVNRLLG